LLIEDVDALDNLHASDFEVFDNKDEMLLENVDTSNPIKVKEMVNAGR
jgi:hypothetical protein